MSNTEQPIEDIPADEIVTMTEYWHKAFKASGCSPMCHCCFKKINIGNGFKLGTVATTDIWHAIDLDLKIRQRNGEVITENILWEAHSVIMRKDFGGVGPAMSYEEYIKIKKKNNFLDRLVDIDERDWERTKERFYNEGTKEVMLCESCTVEEFKKRENEMWSQEIREYNKPKRGGCFRVNGKIIH